MEKKNDENSNIASEEQNVQRDKSLKDVVLENQTGKKINKRNNSSINSSQQVEKPDVKSAKILASTNKKKEDKDRSDSKVIKPSSPEKDKKTIKNAVNLGKEKHQDNNENVKKGREKKINKITILMAVLCIILFLFATDVVTSAQIITFFKSFTSPSVEVKSADVNSSNIPVIGVPGSDSISTGKLSTKIEDEQARLNQIAEDSRVYCIISSSPYFVSADSKGSLYISNPAESVYYTQVVIKTKDTEKEMYVSPVLAPNEKIESDYLSDQSFEPGQYKANAFFNYYQKAGDSGTNDDYMYIGTMVAEISVVINNK